MAQTPATQREHRHRSAGFLAAEDIPLPRGPLTLDEFLALPDAKPAFEFAEGRVIQKGTPQGQHSVLQHDFAALVNHVARPSRIAFAFPELRTTYDGRSFVPDVAVYRWARIPRTPDGDVANRFATPPDIAVEIVSPEQSVVQQAGECLWYVDHGVRIALVVNPDERWIRVYRRGQPPATLRGMDRVDLQEVIPGLQPTVAEVFACLRFD